MIDKIKKNKKLAMLGILVLLIFMVLGLNHKVKVVNYMVETNKVNSNIKIALVTDLHSCNYGERQKILIDLINLNKPDIVMFGGDICDDVLKDNKTEELLKGIAYKYPCYYVTGNHEYWSEDINKKLELFKKYGVTILSNTNKVININSNKINICGVNDPYAENISKREKRYIENVNKVSGSFEEGIFNILLAHRPEYIKAYAKCNFDLVLSGHAHGGQFRIPGIINGVYAPNQGVLPKYAGGEYKEGNTTMIVSRGLAKESTRMPRFYNRPELVFVDIS